ncbi:MAG: UDP-N-acetylglucosamine 4,6-dehydratase [Shewanella sp.]
MDILRLIGREKALFASDISHHSDSLTKEVHHSRFLVIGGAGSIGQAVVKEIFKRSPLKLHVVDLNENNLAELVRDIRSSFGYISGDFQTFTLDVDSIEYDAFISQDGQYDYVLNLSALKHVRSEKDPFTLMRMINVNIMNTDKTIKQSIANGVKKYFCVSTDKAANPVNMMGASKRIMEMFLMRRSEQITISTARFANVAFSDGSLLHSFNQRLLKQQPIVAPTDVKRYFVTPQESGELCLMSCIFGENRDIYFPKLDESQHLISFADLASRYLSARGYGVYLCKSENEARDLSLTLPSKGLWPCYFTVSDTSGEKDFEEFFTEKEKLDMDRFIELGIIKNDLQYDTQLIEFFEQSIQSMLEKKSWTKKQLMDLFLFVLPEFGHKETGKSLDEKM